MIKRIVIAILLILLGGNFGVSQTNAQEQAEVVQRESIDQDIFDLQRSYQGQLDEYRTYEREYQLAKDQHEKLATLTSLESLVQATQKVMVNRILIFETYYRLLRLQTLNAEGMNLQHKERVLAYYDEMLRQISVHQDLVKKAQTRSSLLEAEQRFAEIESQLRATSAYGQALLQVSRLQNVYDKAILLHQKMNDSDTANLSASDQAKRQRALDEIKMELQQIKQDLFFVNQDLEESAVRSSNNYDTSALPSIYDSVSKVVAFFEELL